MLSVGWLAHFLEFRALVEEVAGERTEPSGLVVGERAAEAGALGDGIEDIVHADAELPVNVF